MNAQMSIATLLNDAKHIADANEYVLLSYLISMALLHLEQEIRGSEQVA